MDDHLTQPSSPEDSRQYPAIKDFNPDDRPQEKALQHGCSILPVADLLALILRNGQPGKPVTEMTRELMRYFDNSLHRLQRASRKDMMLIKGMGTVKSLQIEAILELIVRYNTEKRDSHVIIRKSSDIYEEIRYQIGNLPHEEIWAIYLNRRNEVIYKSRITSGTSTASVFDAKKVIREAILHNAEGVVLCHNHPSGNLIPSPQDDNLTRRFAEACKCMDLRMLDHLIVCDSGFYSYNDRGRL